MACGNETESVGQNAQSNTKSLGGPVQQGKYYDDPRRYAVGAGQAQPLQTEREHCTSMSATQGDTYSSLRRRLDNQAETIKALQERNDWQARTLDEVTQASIRIQQERDQFVAANVSLSKRLLNAVDLQNHLRKGLEGLYGDL